MINIIKKNEVIVRYKRGQSIKSIAKDLGIARNTVRTYIRDYESALIAIAQETDKTKIAIMQEAICAKPTRKKYVKTANAFTNEVKQRFDEIIKINAERNKKLVNNKQQLTASLLHRTLISEGYNISESTIRIKFREYKVKRKEAFIKQFYEYGEIAQYDFHQIKVIVNNEKRIYHQATISIPKSNIVFGFLYRNEKMENFIDSLVRFFSFAGGVFKTLVFDNMSNVIKRFCFKNEKEHTDDLIRISNYYGFKIETCNPYRGNEKGHVENSGKNIRRDSFCLKYQFDSEEELYLYYEHELDKRNQAFMEEFEKEKEHLLPLPLHPYELGRIRKAKVDTYSLISIDGNFYSVPDKMVDKVVICYIYTNYLNVFDDKNNLIAIHNKKDGKGEYSLKLEHFYETLLRKPKALKNSYALKQAPVILQTIFNKYFSTKPKEFLHFLMDSEAFNDDFYELGIESGVFKKSKYRQTIEFYKGKKNVSVDETSKMQLQLTADLFGQGEKKK